MVGQSRIQRLLALSFVFFIAACGDSAPGAPGNTPDVTTGNDVSVGDGFIGSDDLGGNDDGATGTDGTVVTDGAAVDGTASDIANTDGAATDGANADSTNTDATDGGASDATSTDGGGACPGGEGCKCESDDDCDSKDCRADAAGGDKICQPPCKPTSPADEVCDGVDNDCDGNIDNKACDDSNSCTDDVCEQAADGKFACSTSVANDGAACDDGSACTSGDACAGGKCTGTATDCDDKNPCTDDTCDPTKGCDNANNTATCDDGSVCTEGEVCADGKCGGGKAKACDDGNSCTKDACDIAAGCTVTNDDATSCDDGDSCTEKDTCKDGACTAGTQKGCDDSDPCTVDQCDSQTGKCKNEAAADGTSCDDGVKCTEGDICTKGTCTGKKATCDDSDPCTTDTCDAKLGCQHKSASGGDCDDSNPCTDEDSCDANGCTGKIKDCDDNNVCTSDSCDPKSGCVNAAVEGKCDDGDTCTGTDACKDGACNGSGAKDCDDSNPCTADGCDANSGECTHKAQEGKCDDGSTCTTADACDGGKCSGKAADCDDNNPCTDDGCDAKTGCTHNNNSAACDDGNACTSKDTCEDGKCVGAPLAKSACDDGNPCTTDSCVPKTGCVNKDADGTTCDDGDACTTKDTCKAGKCESGANSCQCKSDEDCKDDGNLCNGSPICKNNKCVTDPTTVVTCDTSKDASCVKNTCLAASGKCELKAVNAGKPCTEGSPCTLGNTCTKGVCVDGEKPKCDDNNACTTDACDAKTGDCKFTGIKGCTPCKDASVCGDDNPCTKDACVGGKCVNPAVAGCSVLADLKPGAVKLDKSLYLAGSAVVATYNVTNSGQTSAGTRVDRIYLSKDGVFGKGDTLIGQATQLSIGSKKIQTVTLKAKLPSSVASGGWNLIVVVDATNKVKETNEKDNQSVVATKTLAMPDLSLTTFKPDVTASYGGGKITFTLKIDNLGAVGAPKTKAQFYISSDTKVDGKDVKNYAWDVAALAAGKSWTGSRFVIVPKTLANGTWYIGLRLDDASAVTEGSETNNIKWVKVAIGPAADLSPTSLTGATTMVAANKYTLTATEKNLGDKAAGAFVDSIFLSTNSTWSKDDVKLLTISRAGLAKGATTTFKPVVTIPAATKAGKYYLLFVSDTGDAVAEKNEYNNLRWRVVTVVGRPDLKPALTQLTSTGFLPGASGSVKYAESNIGSGNSGKYASRFYLSTNSSYGSGDIALTSHLPRAALLAGKSSPSASAKFTIPANTKPGTYYLLHRADSASQNIEANESNNVAAVKIVVWTKPDIVNSAGKLSATTVTAGSKVTVSYTVSNKGGAPTGLFYNGYYLSTNTTLGSDALLSLTSIANIAGGKAEQRSRTVTIPASTKPGTYYVLVVGDYQKKVSESNEGNNVHFLKITVLAAKLADLQVVSAKLATKTTTFRPGQSVGITVTVKNGGTVSSGTWSYGRYISTNSTISTGDVLMAESNRSSLSPNQTSTFTYYSQIPKNTPPGTRYVGSYVDNKYAVKELSESNNKTAGLKITVLATPDLSAISFKPSKTYYKPGETVSFSSTYTNLGTGATGGFAHGVRLSTNTIISSGDLLLKSTLRPSLAVKTSGSYSGSFKLPTTVKPGIYYMAMRLDDKLAITEISESNNVQYVKVTVQDTATKKADVIPYLTKPTKTAYTAGQTLSWTGYERNIGNVTAATHNTRVYLSRSATALSSAILLKSITVSGLAANGLKNIGGSYTLKSNTGAGTWYVQFRTDYDNKVSELQEGNNVESVKVTVTALADLTSGTLKADKAYYAPGATVKLTWSELNLGGANAGAYVTGVFLSSNSAISNSDTVLAKLNRTGLAAGKALSGAASVTIPATTKPGTWYIGLWLDSTGKVTESSNSNNFRTVAISVTSTATKPDLFITSFGSTASSYKAGQTATVTGAVRNIGKASAGAFRVGYYLSNNTTITKSDTFIGSRSFSGLSANGTASLTAYVKLPVNTKTGTWYIGAIADDEYKVSEGAENNNTASKAVKVTGLIDLSAVKISSGSFYKPGATLSVTVQEKNLGGQAVGVHTIGVYLSTNTFISTTSDKLLANVTMGAVAAGQTVSKTLTVKLPINTAPGNYYLGMFIDPSKKVPEISESNQTAWHQFTVQSTSTKPDLIPYLFKAAKTAYKVGETLSWSGYERNIGGSTAGSHVFRTYLCRTTYVTSSNCILLKSTTKSSLAKNAITSVAGSYKIPNSVGHGTWYLLGSADHNKQVSESIENNNVVYSQLSVAGLADLQAYILNLNKTSFKAGDTVSATFYERNIGGLTAGAHKLRFYLSTNSGLSTADVLLKELSRSALAAGATASGSTSFIIPKTVKAGSYYLGFYTDYYPSVVTETTKSNNTKTRTVTVLSNVAKADLTTSGFTTASTSYNAGSSVSVSGYAKNTGGLNAGAFRIGYYLSTNSTISTTDTLLKSVTRSSLSAGGQTSLATSLALPKDLKAGTYYVGVVVDDLKAVSEISEANNTAYKAVKVVAKADLDGIWFRSNSASYKSGAALTVYINERNFGGATAGAHDIYFYVSTNSTISGSDTYVGKTSVSSLTAGSAISRTVTGLKFPTKSAGVYYLGYRIDPTNKVSEVTTGNNTGWVRVTVPGTSTLPDLTVQSTYTTTSTVAAGQSVYVSGSVKNIGKKTAAAYTIAYYLYPSSFLPSSAKPLKTINKGTLAAGSSTSLSTSITAPANVTGGTWYLHIKVDSTNKVAESYESNNAWLQGIQGVQKADLAVTAAKTSVTSATPGQTMVVTYTVKNSGTTDAKAFYMRAYRSTNSTISTSDTAVGGSVYVALLAPGASKSGSITVKVASTLKPGAKYYYGVYADYTKKVSESTTANNGKSAGVVTIK